MTVAPDEDGIEVRTSFPRMKLSPSAARELAHHLNACADRADGWMRDAADPGPEPYFCPYCGHRYEPGKVSGKEIGDHLAGCPGPREPEPEPEPEPEDYDPGPEVDDQGGMSGHRYHEPEPWQ